MYVYCKKNNKVTTKSSHLNTSILINTLGFSTQVPMIEVLFLVKMELIGRLFIITGINYRYENISAKIINWIECCNCSLGGSNYSKLMNLLNGLFE